MEKAVSLFFARLALDNHFYDNVSGISYLISFIFYFLFLWLLLKKNDNENRRVLRSSIFVILYISLSSNVIFLGFPNDLTFGPVWAVKPAQIANKEQNIAHTKKEICLQMASLKALSAGGSNDDLSNIEKQCSKKETSILDAIELYKSQVLTDGGSHSDELTREFLKEVRKTID